MADADRLRHFFDQRSHHPQLMTPADIDEYVRAPDGRDACIADSLPNRVSIDVGGVSHKYRNRRFEKVISETNFCQCHADGVGWLAPRLFLPSWLVSLVRLVDARGPADLA